MVHWFGRQRLAYLTCMDFCGVSIFCAQGSVDGLGNRDGRAAGLARDAAGAEEGVLRHLANIWVDFAHNSKFLIFFVLFGKYIIY